ncbi:MAG: flavodoxin [Planctomycetaceae bacterium]|jgi:flavodoxin short chain|nr:flavodoxin [Planctomycetaceae bacterium]
MKVSIIYWSGTGNTEVMAKAIKTGAEAANAEVTLLSVDKAGESDVLNADVILFGCPSMGDETLEETEFEPFIDNIEKKITGKKLGLFGSYGWGDGQWMRDWTQRMTNAGVSLVVESLIVNETPSEKDLEQCREFAKNAVNA